MGPKPAWHELEAPCTTQGRLAYLAACQEWFSELRDAGALFADVLVTVRSSEESGRLAPVAYNPAQAVVVGSSQCVRCTVYEGEAVDDDIRAAVLSPFASTVGFLCGPCAGR